MSENNPDVADILHPEYAGMREMKARVTDLEAENARLQEQVDGALDQITRLINTKENVILQRDEAVTKRDGYKALAEEAERHTKQWKTGYRQAVEEGASVLDQYEEANAHLEATEDTIEQQHEQIMALDGWEALAKVRGEALETLLEAAPQFTDNTAGHDLFMANANARAAIAMTPEEALAKED